MFLKCSHSSLCAACPEMHTPYAKQSETKITLLKNKLSNLVKDEFQINFISVGPSSLKDRVDLIAFKGGLGLYSKDKKELFSISECHQMSAPLFSFYQEIKAAEKILSGLHRDQKGSVRLRISPEGKKGIWLDFANTEIQFLFQEKETLHYLQKIAFVEIGQKRKSLFWNESEGRFQLKEPLFETWTRTWINEQQPVPLYSAVGSFSQSSDHCNWIIFQNLKEILKKTKGRIWLEFGCGTGNLTFPLLPFADKIVALEFETLAVNAFQQTLKKTEFTHQENPVAKINLKLGDFQKVTRENIIEEQDINAILVNPPRSGLKDFLKPLFSMTKKSLPKDFIYMSCYLDSFTEDSEKLVSLGYQLEDIRIIDQFPQSHHFEILSYWRLSL